MALPRQINHGVGVVNHPELGGELCARGQIVGTVRTIVRAILSVFHGARIGGVAVVGSRFGGRCVHQVPGESALATECRLFGKIIWIGHCVKSVEVDAHPYLLRS